MNDVSEDSTSDAFEQQLSRFVVGIDLGTTNAAVAFIDTNKSRPKVETFRVEQWVDFDTREARELLPSFYYQPTSDELRALSTNGEVEPVVGCLARDRGLQLPGRQIASAKSWLCHDGVDREAPILPWQGDDDVVKLSPVEASSRYLGHIRAAWDKQHRNHPLAEQEVVLTLPASFDQVARQLTIQAAKLAGLPRVVLIEEPQAAFYAWLNLHQDGWEQIVAPGQAILVCDIGGGTTDFTLIRVRHASQAAQEFSFANADSNPTRPKTMTLHRVAVGQHLILGGDNLDLALAKFAETKLGKQLAPRAWDALRQACRVTKEVLLGDHPPATYTIHLPGTGSRLIGSGTQVEISAAEVEQVILDGFLPQCVLTDRPQTAQVGFQEFGLPYAHDAAITRHLASFLWDHRTAGRLEEEAELSDQAAARPDWLLFNGGVLASSQIRERIQSSIALWFAGHGCPSDWQPQVLQGERLDLAVAHGAAYFGQVRRGQGVQIEAKLARSYYLTVSQDPPQVVCIIPGSASPGDKFRLDTIQMELAIGQPVQFPIFYSATRLADEAGKCYEVDPQHFMQLPPIRTVLELPGKRRQERLPVFIEAELTQIGTLQIWCVSTDGQHRWALEFDVRATTETDRRSLDSAATQQGIVDASTAGIARDVLEQVFAPEADLKPTQVMQALSDRLQLGRQAWPPSLLRSMWLDLMELEAGRRKSADHEARWLNLLGYTLRPGYGLAADDWRVAQTWRNCYGKLAFAAPTSRSESLILWRRIAGGFTAGQQLAVFQQVAGPLRSVLDPAKRAKGGGSLAPHEFAELLRLVGSLELLPKADKSQLGDWLIALLRVKKWASSHAPILWAIGRLGSRVPTYGPLNTVVDAQHVESWLSELQLMNTVSLPALQLALMQCARRVHDRYRDVHDLRRADVIAQLQATNAPPHYLTLVSEGGQLAHEEANQIIGESLPLGLSI